MLSKNPVFHRHVYVDDGDDDDDDGDDDDANWNRKCNSKIWWSQILKNQMHRYFHYVGGSQLSGCYGDDENVDDNDDDEDGDIVATTGEKAPSYQQTGATL